MQSKPPTALKPLIVLYTKKKHKTRLVHRCAKAADGKDGLEETKAKEDFEDHKVGSTVTAGESLLPSVLQWRH